MSDEKIIAVQRNHFGDILSFKTSEGRVISYRKAILEAEAGQLHGVNLIDNPNGPPTLTPIDDFSFEQYPNIY